MDNVILWIKSNKDVVDAYRKTKQDCNYYHRTDNDFLMFLLEAATNVLSIVHQFSPQITCSSLHNEASSPVPETIVTKECDINLEKLDKQLRINIVCPELDDQPGAASNINNKEQEPLPESNSTTALQDISNHVNELESVVESLNKSCPSPLPSISNMRTLTSRSFLDNFKSHHQAQQQVVTPQKHYRDHESVGFKKFKTPNIMISKRSFNNTTGSSPNVTISAESQLNMLSKSQQPQSLPTTIATPIPHKPIPINSQKPPPPPDPEKEREKSPTLEDKDVAIDVVNTDTNTSADPDNDQINSSINSLKRKADCLDNSQNERESSKSPVPGPSTAEQPSTQLSVSEDVHQTTRPVTSIAGGLSTITTSAITSSVSSSAIAPLRQHQDASTSIKTERLPSPDHHGNPGQQAEYELPKIPTDSELTQQLMSAFQQSLQSSLSLHALQHSQSPNITCHECGIVFQNEINLHRHMLTTHIESKKGIGEEYSCPTCAFKTPRKQTLEKHVSTVHNKNKSSGVLYCDQCEYNTPTKSHLRNHMLAHSGNRQYQCPHCTYNSNFSNALTRHMTMHSRQL